MKKAKKNENAKSAKFSQLSMLAKSFKVNSNYLVVALYIIGFVVFSKLALVLLNSGFESMGLAGASLDEVAAAESVFGAYASLMLLAGLVFLIIVLAFSAACAGIWSTIIGKKFNFRTALKLFLVNIVWIPVFIMALVGIFLALAPWPLASLIISIIALLILLHISCCFHYSYVREERLVIAFEKLYSIGVLKFHKFLLPGLMIFVFFIIASLIAYPFQLISEAAYSIAVALLMLLLVVWSEMYYGIVIGSVYSCGVRNIKAGAEKNKK